jgi:hypothetical protein
MKSVYVTNKETGIVVAEVRFWAHADLLRTVGREEIKTVVRRMYIDLVEYGMTAADQMPDFTVRLWDECPECLCVKEDHDSPFCENWLCGNGFPSRADLALLMKRNKYHKDECAEAYFNRLTAIWKEECKK